MNKSPHTFHIPVMGLAFTIDTPIRVAKYGISSVVSLVEDVVIELMRKHYCEVYNEPYTAISEKDEDYRARRITAYLNLLNKIINQQIEDIKKLDFAEGNDLTKYFEMLPDNAPLKESYLAMLALPESTEKEKLKQLLKEQVVPGKIDVNIMSKLDKMNFAKDGTELPAEFSDASAALRGFALSDLDASMVFSAGYNPRLYNYIDQFQDFFADKNGYLKKRITIKVSDYRSAQTQGKLLAKKGIWVSEYRIESGLNCGGHAFATEGLLLGPILDEFKKNREALSIELLNMCNDALTSKGLPTFNEAPHTAVTVQGGIGTAEENNFLLDYYKADSTGWGSPFLLVPEASSLDEETRNALASAKPEDYYLSESSPLGVPFNNFRNSSSEAQRKERIEKNRPGSACYKKYLISNTEFTEDPICSASRQFIDLKIKQLNEKELSAEEKAIALDKITVKDCLCEGLGAAALLNAGVPVPRNLNAVTVCPGPNLAYFSGIFTLRQMVDHIYGRANLLNSVKRSHMFVNELTLYVNYLKSEISKYTDEMTNQKNRYFKSFQNNLLQGVDYYKSLSTHLKVEAKSKLDEFKEDLEKAEKAIKNLVIPAVAS